MDNPADQEDNRTDNQLLRKQRNRERAIRRRQRETSEEREQRREVERLRAAARRQGESIEEKEKRRRSGRLRAKRRRDMETEEEKQIRRERNRLRMAERRRAQRNEKLLQKAEEPDKVEETKQTELTPSSVLFPPGLSPGNLCLPNSSSIPSVAYSPRDIPQALPGRSQQTLGALTSMPLPPLPVVVPPSLSSGISMHSLPPLSLPPLSSQATTQFQSQSSHLQNQSSQFQSQASQFQNQTTQFQNPQQQHTNPQQHPLAGPGGSSQNYYSFYYPR